MSSFSFLRKHVFLGGPITLFSFGFLVSSYTETVITDQDKDILPNQQTNKQSKSKEKSKTMHIKHRHHTVHGSADIENKTMNM